MLRVPSGDVTYAASHTSGPEHGCAGVLRCQGTLPCAGRGGLNGAIGEESSLERSAYFLAGDLLSNAVTGMATAWLVTGIVDPAWHMPSGMLAGMLAAMGLSLLLMPVFVALFGAMEVMLPVMLTAMLAGMLLGMASAMTVISTWQALVAGGLIGTLTLLSTYALDASLRRRGL